MSTNEETPINRELRYLELYTRDELIRICQKEGLVNYENLNVGQIRTALYNFYRTERFCKAKRNRYIREMKDEIYYNEPHVEERVIIARAYERARNQHDECRDIFY